MAKNRQDQDTITIFDTIRHKLNYIASIVMYLLKETTHIEKGQHTQHGKNQGGNAVHQRHGNAVSHLVALELA